MSWFAQQLKAQQPAPVVEQPKPEEPPKNRGGRPKVYASTRERQRAWRARKRDEKQQEATDGQR